MAKITRIKASDGPRKEEKSTSKKTADADEPTITRKKVVVKDKKTEKTKRAKIKAAEKTVAKSPETKKSEKSEKKPFILARPFVAVARYLKESWYELRQVRWPDRKTTWKMVLAVLVYTLIFVAIISLLDLFFSWLFGLILGN